MQGAYIKQSSTYYPPITISIDQSCQIFLYFITLTEGELLLLNQRL